MGPFKLDTESGKVVKLHSIPVLAWSSIHSFNTMGSNLSGLLSSPGKLAVTAAPATNPPAVHPLKTLKIDKEGILKRYGQERAKRIRDDGLAQFKPASGVNSHFKDDSIAPVTPRDPINSETTVLIVGGGFAGLVTAIELKRRGVTQFVILDRAGGFGGTWYWNQYPGRFLAALTPALSDTYNRY